MKTQFDPPAFFERNNSPKIKQEEFCVRRSREWTVLWTSLPVSEGENNKQRCKQTQTLMVRHMQQPLVMSAHSLHGKHTHAHTHAHLKRPRSCFLAQQHRSRPSKLEDSGRKYWWGVGEGGGGGLESWDVVPQMASRGRPPQFMWVTVKWEAGTESLPASWSCWSVELKTGEASLAPC